jgi:RimJ/RimL family protein N-acetyltransferase
MVRVWIGPDAQHHSHCLRSDIGHDRRLCQSQALTQFLETPKTDKALPQCLAANLPEFFHVNVRYRLPIIRSRHELRDAHNTAMAQSASDCAFACASVGRSHREKFPAPSRVPAGGRSDDIADSGAGAHQWLNRKKFKGELLDWHIFVDGVLCGSVRVNRIELADRKAKLAYFLDAQYQGRGIVTRSARAVIDVCFKELELNRLELRCVTTNTTSVAVAERLGFSREGLLRQDEFLNGKFVDHYLYALLRQDLPAV